MPRLEIVLEEGFDGEPVTVAVDGAVVFDEPAVRTRRQIGFAGSAVVEVPPKCRVEARIASSGTVAGLDVDVTRTPYVWFSHGPGGLTGTVGAAAHRYA